MKAKMFNLQAYDPHRPGGLSGGSKKIEPEIWKEFEENPTRIVMESEQLMMALEEHTLNQEEAVVRDASLPSIEEIEIAQEGWETGRLIKVRNKQGTFRKMILASYDSTCCMTGINVPELLIASHIAPWASHPKNRLDPRNGLCLNALHDRAFDRGLISVDAKRIIKVSERMKEAAKESEKASFIAASDGREINMPKKENFSPSAEFLEYHHKNIFVDNHA